MDILNIDSSISVLTVIFYIFFCFIQGCVMRIILVDIIKIKMFLKLDKNTFVKLI